MISSSSDGRVRKAIASEVVDLGMITSPVKPKTQELVFHSQLLYSTLSVKGTVLVRMVMTIFKTLENFKQVLVSVSVLTFQERTVLVFKILAK